MKTWTCDCDNTLFFDNSLCLSCSREVGHCPHCDNMVALEPTEDNQFRCTNPDCAQPLLKCVNYSQHMVCNRCVPAASGPNQTCDCCRFNRTVPDLTVAENQAMWARLESAKRRLFYDLNQLGLPYGTALDGIEPALAFDFKGDAIVPNNWKNLDSVEKVFTGHDAGVITINIREADDAEREKARVTMGEPKRTLIRHFRHEVGHFYWEVLVKGRREEECVAVFGDHNNPTYDAALKKHYEQGPPADWAKSFVSSYATMHPWEDFAECWATYFDMISALDTASNMGLRGGETDPVHANILSMIARYTHLGVVLNELNRSMGMLDAVPEVFVQPVVEKLTYIHNLVQQGRKENKFLQRNEMADAAAHQAG